MLSPNNATLLTSALWSQDSYQWDWIAYRLQDLDFRKPIWQFMSVFKFYITENKNSPDFRISQTIKISKVNKDVFAHLCRELRSLKNKYNISSIFKFCLVRTLIE